MSLLRKAFSFPSRRLLSMVGVFTLILTLSTLFGTSWAAGDVNILETGSSLVYPLFNLWVPDYTKMHSTVKITTQSTGSGTGISQASEGLAQIGTSDAYMADALMKQHPDMLNIPMCISSQMVNYNVPELNSNHLKFSGPVLAAIYQGKITKWNDPQIAALNKGVALPDHAIIPVHRSDGSGDTFIFTQYLAFSTPDWSNSLSYGTTVSWPAVSGELGAQGNQGMITAIQGNPYSVAYIGTSYMDTIDKDSLGTAMLQNKDGKFVLPTPKTAAAAAGVMVPKTPADARVSLIFAPGADSYPIINYEYAIVNSKQPAADTAKELRDFLTWAISAKGGNAPNFMEQVHFTPLPPSVAKLTGTLIAKIQ